MSPEGFYIITASKHVNQFQALADCSKRPKGVKLLESKTIRE
jgi:hypothetical protein